MNYRKATYQDLSFIIDTYNANINALHGEIRDYRIWEKLLDKEGVEILAINSSEESVEEYYLNLMKLVTIRYL